MTALMRAIHFTHRNRMMTMIGWFLRSSVILLQNIAEVMLEVLFKEF